MKSLLLLTALLSAGACRKSEDVFRDHRDELLPQLAKIRACASDAKARMPELHEIDGDGAKLGSPKTLTPVPAIGGPYSTDAKEGGYKANALFLALRDLDRLGTDRVNTWFDAASGSSCVDAASGVLEHAASKGYGSDEFAEDCASFLVGLRYVVVMREDVDTDSSEDDRTFHSTEEFRGRATLCALGAPEATPVVAFSASVGQRGDTVMRREEFKSAQPAALLDLAPKLERSFPGITVPAKWRQKH
ncbi:MAG TPA: hypothetical protein VGM90_00935 [Kofleriaceae bacterium]